MIILQSISTLLWLLLVPILMGKIFWREKAGFFKEYLSGIVCMFAAFELIAVPIIFFKCTLNLLTFLWCLSCTGIIIVGILRKRIVFSNEKRKLRFHSKYIPGYGAIALILFQVVYVGIHMHIDDDDAWYVGTAVTSYFTNTIYQINPYTGVFMEMFPADYTLSPYPVFWAVLGKLTCVHPAILMHTIAPIVLIPASYMVYYLIANILFKDKREDVGYFMLFLSVFNMFANFSVRSVSTFMLFRIWQGKATLCSVMVPLAVYIFMLSIQKNTKKYWILEILVVMAGTMVSSMGVFLMPVLLSALTVVFVIAKRDIRIGIRTIICILPCFVQFMIYCLVLR